MKPGSGDDPAGDPAGDTAGDPAGVDRLWAALSGWSADARADEAAAARAREAWLRRQAEAEATLTGLLVDLAERATDVMIDLAAGEQTARGRLQAIGTDFVVVTTRDRRLCLVATTAIVALRAVDASGARGAAGDRLSPLGTSLVDALALLAAERPPIQVVLRPAGRTIAGQLASVGADLVIIHPAVADAAASVAIPLEAIAACQLA